MRLFPLILAYLVSVVLPFDSVAQTKSLVSGKASLSFEMKGGFYVPSVSVAGKRFSDDAFSRGWISLEFGEKKLTGRYSELSEKNGKVALRGTVKASDEVTFRVTDVFSSSGKGEFRVRRRVEVVRTDDGEEPGYFTSFAIDTGDRFGEVEPFVPSVMYKNMFDDRANPGRMGLKRDHREFLFREDRLPLPLVMFRRRDGLSAALILEDTGNRTVLDDCEGVRANPGYRFGGVGFRRSDDDAFDCAVTYPGCDRRAWGMGSRRHPSKNGQRDDYALRLRFDETPDYGSAVALVWNRAVELYNPPIYATHTSSARRGLLDTLYSYRQSPDGDQDLVKSTPDKPGFPWCVELEKEFKVWDWTYEIGFVGAQPVAGYCLLQAGVLEGNAGWRKHGEAVVDFWARESLSELGFPNSRYYPLNKCWDGGNTCTIRQASTGFCGVMDAWSFLKKRGEDRPEWIAACRRLGDWLVDNQAADGSWPMEVNPRKVVNGKHPVVRANKALTVCGVTYLSRLYSATKDAKYRSAAIRAAEFAYDMQHRDYLYVACVIDNPEVFDSESGYEAMKAFISIYEIDQKKKWLDAARQAAVYAETWVYMHEIPPEDDATPGTPWPFDKSVVGQHILTIDQAGADLGFAWTAYWYYRLWQLTKDSNFLKMSQIALHDTKQSMNLGGELYPGRGEGLQCEVCTLRTTGDRRRGWVMKQALTWNFAAHLQQYASFIEATGKESPPELKSLKSPPKKKPHTHGDGSAPDGQERLVPSRSDGTPVAP